MFVRTLSKTFAPLVGNLTICLRLYPDLSCLSGNEFKSPMITIPACGCYCILYITVLLYITPITIVENWRGSLRGRAVIHIVSKPFSSCGQGLYGIHERMQHITPPPLFATLSLLIILYPSTDRASFGISLVHQVSASRSSNYCTMH